MTLDERAEFRAAEADRIRSVQAGRKLTPAEVARRARSRAARRHGLAPQTDDDRRYEEALRADPCSYCGRPAEAIDHVHPLARGGGNGWDNLAAACTSCNSSKGTRSLIRFLAERRFSHGQPI